MTPHELTETQISILETGMTATEFILTAPQRASRPQRMVDMKLIEQASKGKYRITDLGREAYKQHMIAQAQVQTPSFEVMDFAEQAAPTGINWYEVVIKPLIDLIEASEPDAFVSYAGFVNDDPSLIVRSVRVILKEVTDTEEKVNQQLLMIEQRDSTIESLRREIGALKEKLLGIQPTRADVYLAGQILDELCEMIPEVEEYRLARENAVKAISSLKARR